MAIGNRFIEWVASLKDGFSSGVEKIKRGYRELGDTGERTSRRIATSNKQVEASFIGLGTALSKVRGLYAKLAAVAATAAGTRSIAKFADEADRLGKTAGKLGVAVDELSALQFAAERSGVSLNTLNTGLQRMLRRTAEAAQGTGEAVKALKELGIDAERFNKLSLDEKMQQLALAFSSVADEQDRLRLAFKLFDSEGVGFLNLLKDGPGALRELTEQARKFGAVLDKDETDAAEKFNDALTNLNANIDGITNPAKTAAVEALNDLFARFGKAADPLDNITAAIERQTEILNQSRLAGLTANANAAFDELVRLSKQYDEIVSQREKADADEKARIAEQSAEQERAKRAEEAEKQATEAVAAEQNKRLTSAQQKLDAETREYEKAKEDQLQIEKEFTEKLAAITAPNQEDVSLIDVFLAKNKANAALAQGDIDEALRFADQGADLLGSLKEKGTETTGTLGFLAKELQRVASEAAKTRTESEQADVIDAQALVDSVQAQGEQIKTLATTIGSQYAQEIVRAANEVMRNTTLEAPNVAAPVITTIGDGTADNPFRRGIKRELDKRGDK